MTGDEAWSRKTWWVAIGLASGAALVYLCLAIWFVPRWAANGVRSSDPAAQAAARSDERGSVRTAMLALLAGGIAAVGAVYTGRTFALNRRGQVTERFTRAVDQLGQTDNSAVRLGGIYALERIAHESATEHRAIVYVLAAYVRENSPWPPTGVSQDAAPPEAAEDIKAIIAVLRRREVRYERNQPIKVDLDHTNLRGIHASGIHLEAADLSGARLDNVDLTNARLQGANLDEAILHEADLRGAHLDGARMNEAKLLWADLRGADLREASLLRTELTHAKLEGVDLSGATDLHRVGQIAQATWGEYRGRETTWPEDSDPEALAKRESRIAGRLSELKGRMSYPEDVRAVPESGEDDGA
jgi:hypothetical protein